MKMTIAVLGLCCVAGAAHAASDPGKLTGDLLKAAGKGDLVKVRALMQSGASVNAQDKDGHTALLRTAQEGRAEVARALLESEADPNLTDKDGKTPLWEAARHEKADVVALLLQHKANVELADKDGDTPLLQAVQKGNASVVEQLLAAGANSRVRGKTGATVLMAAASGGQAEILRTILKRGGDVDELDNDGESALFYAARKGRGVDTLLEAHARVDRLSRSHLTPLMAAAQGGQSEAARALLQAGAQPDLRNDLDKNWTALMYAAKGGASTVVEVLAEAGAHVNAEDTNHDLPIHIAAHQSSGSTVRALVSHGSDVNRRSGSDRKTPLEIAVEGNDRDIASALVDGGACVTPAMTDHATAKKDEKMIAILSAGSGRGCRKP